MINFQLPPIVIAHKALLLLKHV